VRGSTSLQCGWVHVWVDDDKSACDVVMFVCLVNTQHSRLTGKSTDIDSITLRCFVGIFVDNRLTATDHVDHLLSSCASLLYALRVRRSHGIPSTSLQDVFRATVVAKVTYCAPAWSGTCSAPDRARLDSFQIRLR